MTRPPFPDRRELLGSCSILGASLAAGFGLGCAGVEAERAPAPAPDPLGAAYARFHDGYPHETVERSSHAPMVVEALHALGHGAAIGPWLDAHLEARTPERLAAQPVRADDWRAALGTQERFVDWRKLFLAELRHEDWRAVLARWAPRLAPGVSAAAFHGVIRSGHAVRSLEGQDDELRRFELATGLAYWASSYLALPWDGSVAPAPSVEAAVQSLRMRQPERERPAGNLVKGLRSLEELPFFRPVAGLVDVREPARALTEIAAAFARVYLRHPAGRTGFAHVVTGPSAVRLLTPYVDEASAVALARHAWQAAAGLYVTYGDARAREPVVHAAPRAELVAASLANGAPHALKLTEVCLREEALCRAPVLLAAAQDASVNLHG